MFNVSVISSHTWSFGVAEKAELAKHVDAHEHDRCPPRPARATDQGETDTHQDDPHNSMIQRQAVISKTR